MIFGELVPGSIKIHHLNSLTVLINGQHEFIQIIGILKFKEVFLLASGAD